MKITAIKNNLILAFGVIALTGGVLIAAASAVAGREHRDHHIGHFVENVAEKLSLNDTQEARLESLMHETAEERRRLRDETGAEIRKIFSQETLSREDAHKLLQLRKSRRDEMQDFVAGQIAAFHSELDSAQREKLAAEAPKFLARISGGGHGKRGKHGKHGYDGDDHHRGWFGFGRHHDDDDDDDDDDY